MPYQSSDGFPLRVVAIAVGVVFALILGLFGLSGLAFADTQSDEIACVWNGGPLDNSNYRGYQPPGSGKTMNGFKSKVVTFPASVRNYKISLDPTLSETGLPDSIKVSVAGVPMEFEPKLFFHFNAAEDPTHPDRAPYVCQWWEQEGKRFKAKDFNTDAADGGKWAGQYLPQQFRPKVNEVFAATVQDLARRIPDGLPKALYLDEQIDPDGEGPEQPTAARAWLSTEVGRRMPTALEDLMHKPYFCGRFVPPSATPEGKDAKLPECPPFQVILDVQPVMDQGLASTFTAAQAAAAKRAADVSKATEESRQAVETSKIRAEQAQSEATAAESRADADRRRQVAEASTQSANEARALSEQRVAYAKCIAVGGAGGGAAALDACARLLAAEQGKYPNIVVAPAPATAP